MGLSASGRALNQRLEVIMMQIIGMIIGIAFAICVLHINSIPGIFPFALMGWFIGLFMSGGGSRQGGSGGAINASDGGNK